MSLRQQAGRVVRRIRRIRLTVDGQDSLIGDDCIDVRKLLDTYTVDELSEAADEYYRKNIDGIDFYHAKPLATIDDAPDLLISFAQVLAGIRPIRGMRVLDFGAGTGWTSRMLTQLGCEVVVCDVSGTALDIAKELFDRQPVAGDQPAPTFLQWDGFRFDLADESIDRIICFDAFHHVPNPAKVLAEMGRVLKPGGVAGFQEPGPNHSKGAQSQFEMKQFRVIENDIIMGNIERWARFGGFTDVKLAVFTSDQFQTSIEGYNSFLAGGVTLFRHYKHMRPFVAGRRIFFLSKGERATPDSRERLGLDARLEIQLDVTSIASGCGIVGHARAKNTGTTDWLPSDAPVGPVLLGVHLRDAEGRYLARDYARIALPHGCGGRQDGSCEGRCGVTCGETASFTFEVTAPDTSGEYQLEFDLVAEHVAWFEFNGVPTVSVPIVVT